MEDYLPIEFISDSKGYWDRECPNENCLYTFKIHMQDWKDKMSESDMHCPMCGHVDGPTKWWTQKQLADMSELCREYAMAVLQGEVDKLFGSWARNSSSKYVQVKYTPGKKITFVNNPIGQSEEWLTEIKCDSCGTRYSVIGSAYFCPCCGYNSAENVFEESMDSIQKMLDSSEEMKNLLVDMYGIDKADTMVRSMVEGTLGDVVSAFQKFAEQIFTKHYTGTVRVNDFQIVEKGSQLFCAATGKGYSVWLTDRELTRMNLLFQRRHLIEHNAGIVDQKYLDKTADHAYIVGQRIVVKVDDAYELIGIVKKLAAGLRSAR